MLRVVGEGSQKTVYLARDAALERECAVAVLRSEAIDADALARLRREAQAMARLGGHPNIVGVYDIGEADDGRPFIVCEYVVGGDLRRILRESNGPLPMERALAIITDVANALVATHEQGIIHRDVKPANVWLTADGAAKLGDFGLAAALDRSRITMTGTVMGTAAYMPPEQALSGEVETRSDLYALGAVFYELVSGRPPFLGDDALAIVSQHINVAPVAPSWLNAAVTRPIEELILRLLAKSPDERPATAAEVVAELARITTAPAADNAASASAGAELGAIAWGRFVGRRDELEQLKVAFDQALSGQGSLAMIAGEPGIGKTRLSEELSVYARLRGAVLMHGRCYEGDGGMAYQPFIDAFRHFVRTRPNPPLRSELGEGAPEIATLVSEVRRRFPDLPDAMPAEGEAQRLRLFESVIHFMLGVAQSAPLVLVLDDLQWADKASLLLLRHAVPEIAHDRVFIVGIYRDAELDRKHPLADAIGSLRRENNYHRVLVRGLSEDSVEELLASMSESDDDPSNRRQLVGALFRETEGNPFFIREILSHLIEERKLYRKDGRWIGAGGGITALGIPEGVREVIGRRLSRLSDACNQMLVVASALKGGFSWDALRAVTDESEETLVDLLDEAVSAQLISERKRDQPGMYDFTHGLIGQTLYEELSGPRRILMHRRIADALELLYAPSRRAHLAELAHHFYEAAPRGDAEKAIAYALEAGDAALAVTAYDEAVQHYEHALLTLDLVADADVTRRCDLMIRLGDALTRAGEPKRAVDSLQQAATIARELRSADLVARTALALGSIQMGLGQVHDPVVEILEEALSLLPEDDSAIRARVLSKLARAHNFSNFQEEGVHLTGLAVEMARRIGDLAVLAMALDDRLFMMADPAYIDERLKSASELLALSNQLRDRVMTARGMTWRIIDLFAIGDVDAADEALPLANALANEVKLPLFYWYLDIAHSMRAIVEGRFADAELLAAKMLTSGQRVEGSQGIQLYAVQMIALRWEQGRLKEVEVLFEGLRSQFDTFPALRGVLAFFQSELGRLDDARQTFEVLATAGFETLRRDTVWLMSVSLLSQTCATLGDGTRARAVRTAPAIPEPQRLGRRDGHLRRRRVSIPRPPGHDARGLGECGEPFRGRAAPQHPAARTAIRRLHPVRLRSHAAPSSGRGGFRASGDAAGERAGYERRTRHDGAGGSCRRPDIGGCTQPRIDCPMSGGGVARAALNAACARGRRPIIVWQCHSRSSTSTTHSWTGRPPSGRRRDGLPFSAALIRPTWCHGWKRRTKADSARDPNSSRRRAPSFALTIPCANWQPHGGRRTSISTVALMTRSKH